MSVKLNKVNKEIEKVEGKISELQAKHKALLKEKTDLENLDMIDFLRKNKVSHSDLYKVIDTLHEEKGATIPLKTELTEVKENEEI